MGRFITFVYGLASYLLAFVTLLYAIGFVSGLAVPKTIDSGATGPIVQAVIVNLLLVSVFAIQHSVMARKPFKRWWTQFVPEPVNAALTCCFQASRSFYCSGNGVRCRPWSGTSKIRRLRAQ